MARCRAFFDDSFAGRPRILLLVGEPGIGRRASGKSSPPTRAYAARRSTGGAATKARGRRPFWPWVQIVRAFAAAREPAQLRRTSGSAAPEIASMVSEIGQVLPDLPEPPRLDPEQARFRLFAR